MTRLEHIVTIQRPLADVFALARQVERYPEFLPGYIESKIIKRSGEALLLARAAMVKGGCFRWKSWVRFEHPKAIRFEQVEGPLQGMQVDWLFDAVNASETRVRIIHRIHLQRFFGRFLMERMIFAPKISAMAAEVVNALKRVCEDETRRQVFV